MDDSLRGALEDEAARALGFLPRQVPADVFPDEWRPWLDAARELPGHFHGAGAREWLEARFAAAIPGLDTAAAALPEPQADRLITVLSVLGHAYRWNCVPPTAAEYARTAIRLPPGIEAPWAALARRYGHPRVGTLASMVTSNWRLPGKRGGDAYAAEELLDGAAEPAILWLAPPKDEALGAFLRTGIETEALGARILVTAVALIQATDADDSARVGALLERLQTELTAMGRPFKHYIQKHRFTGDDFLTLIQPATLWGLDEGEGLVEGASGPQLGALQVADAILGVSRDSPMGRSVVGSRRFVPARHRRMLEHIDRAAPCVRAYVLERDDGALSDAFDGCVQVLKAWRLVHQKRGAAYLRTETAGAAAAYTSTGGVVALEDERVRRFEGAMQERVDETDGAFVRG